MGIIRHGGEGKPTKEKRRGGRGAAEAAAAAASKQRTNLKDGAGATPAAHEGPGTERAGEECPYESGPRGQRGCAPITGKIPWRRRRGFTAAARSKKPRGGREEEDEGESEGITGEKEVAPSSPRRRCEATQSPRPA